MELPNVDINLLEKPSFESVQPVELAHPPRFLLLYGSIVKRHTVDWRLWKQVFY